MESINIRAIQANATKSSGAKAVGTKGFDDILGAAGAMSDTAMTAGQMYGPPNASTVLASAFSGIGQLSAMSAPAYATGAGFGGGGMGGGGMNMAGSYGLSKASSAYMPSGIPGSSGGSSVIPGTEGFSQWDMINTMNQNNLQLLELQALMQSNMQSWNTKSNILSADHRARMSMIEKFTARG